MTLPPITAKQQAILKLVYRYRFIDRIQIQALIGHKDKKRIGTWLKDLRHKQYLGWIYDSTSPANKTTPAIYYLALNGVRYLRTTNQQPPEELGKRYRESSRQPAFIARCRLIADCGIMLGNKSLGSVSYSYATQADYINPEHEYNFLAELEPQLCFIKASADSRESWLLEVFDATTPRYNVKKRLNDYVQYLLSGEWESETGEDEPPVLLVACPSVAELIYAKRRARKLLENYLGDLNEDDETIPHICFATTEQVKQRGVTAMIWEET